MSDKEQKALIACIIAVVETVVESDPLIGAPGGPLYAALQVGIGMDIDGFTRLMGTVVHAGLVTKRGQCYFPTDKGREFAAKVGEVN